MKPTVPPFQHPSQRGIALLTVLALLTLTAILVLAFFSISQTELRSTTCYAGGAEAHALSKTAVDLVQHQIRAATEDSGLVWASQPGAIRVWGKNQGQESVAAYKLYSDDNMTCGPNPMSTTTVPANFDQALYQDTMDMRDWYRTDKKDVYVDLNEPILRTHVDQAGRERVKVYYPIVDPRAYPKGAQRQSVTRSDWNDPSSNSDDRKKEVEGFFFETDTVERGPYPKMNGSKIDHHVGLPMPVKWLYQLKDGTLGTLEGGGIRPVFKAVSGDGYPSQNNPMVGRIAFWADDETCKLNVNTAAGGSPWDTPRAGGKTDRDDFAAKPPVQKEWQRYPGHPATTSLSPVLYPWRRKPGQIQKADNRINASDVEVRDAQEQIYDMIPRVEKGGSAGGIDFWKIDSPLPIKQDYDRLYATIDEFIFSTQRSDQGLRKIQEKAGIWGMFDGDYLDRIKFFLTTSSRAPEVTMFNTPRISMWPTYYPSSYTSYNSKGSNDFRRYTMFDRQIRFCSEVGQRSNDFGDIYHFQRYDEDSPTYDYDQIPRNRQLFSYLCWLMSQDVPGVGKSFVNKYGSAECQQIATEIFDYIRCTDLFDDMVFVDNNQPSETAYGQNPDFKGHFAYTNNRIKENSHMQIHPGHGQVTPIEIKPSSGPIKGQTTKGFGRFYGVNEVGVAFIATASLDNEKLLLGGEKIHNYRDTGTDWKRGSGQKHNFEYTNVPPFKPGTDRKGQPLGDLNQAKFNWDGRVLDDNKEADKPIIDAQNHIAGAYNLTYSSFQNVPDKIDRWNYMRNRANWNYTMNPSEPLKPDSAGGASGSFKPLRRVQAILLFSMFCPSKGWTAINPDFRLQVELTKQFSVKGNVAGDDINDLFSNKKGLRPNPFTLKTLATYARYWNQRPQGGILEPRAFVVGQDPKDLTGYNQRPRYTPDYEYWRANMEALANYKGPDRPTGDPSLLEYPWVSDPFTVNGEDFRFGGGEVELKVFPGGGATSGDNAGAGGQKDPTQFVRIAMDECKMPLPNISDSAGGIQPPSTSRPVSLKSDPNSYDSQTNAKDMWCFSRYGCFTQGSINTLGSPNEPSGRFAFYHRDPGYNGSLIRGVENAGAPKANPPYNTATYSVDPDDKASAAAGVTNVPFDVVRSYVIPHGDFRLAMAKKASSTSTPDLKSTVPDSGGADFVPATGYFNKDPNDPGKQVFSACSFSLTSSARGYGRYETSIEWSGNSRRNRDLLARTVNNPDMDPNIEPQVPRNIWPDFNGQPDDRFQSHWGDWDNCTAAELDGAFINKPDEGNRAGISNANYVNSFWAAYGWKPRQFIPYYTEPNQQVAPGAAFFSPNRIMPGPGVLGSLPTGVIFSQEHTSNPKPWQTLLFRPLPNNGRSASGSKTHPGYEDPKDHYMLDFFWMPVVEPWSVSEPFSTAGKINLNYAMQPFAHIKRASALIGAMFSEQMLTIPADQQRAYKGSWGMGAGYNWISDSGGTLRTPSLRSFINYNETLKQFDEKFNSRGLTGYAGQGDLFRSASELCEKWLVPDPIYPPQGSNGLGQKFTVSNTAKMWDQNNELGFTLTGDNSRERPYTVLLARLTTKSNTFQVHYRAQIIKQAPVSPSDPTRRRMDQEYRTFDSDVDGVTAEYRGSTTLERYIDPNEALNEPDPTKRLPDYADDADKGNLKLGIFNSLDKFYRFRVVSEKRFAP